MLLGRPPTTVSVVSCPEIPPVAISLALVVESGCPIALLTVTPGAGLASNDVAAVDDSEAGVLGSRRIGLGGLGQVVVPGSCGNWLGGLGRRLVLGSCGIWFVTFDWGVAFGP